MGGLVSSIFGGGKPKVATAPSPYEQAPEFVQKAYEQFFNRGTDLSNQTAPFAPINNQYMQQAANIAAGGAPPMGFMQLAKSSFDNAGRFLQDASGNIRQGTNPITTAMIGQDTTDLLNPYTANVIDKLRGIYSDRLNEDLSNIASNSTLAGAFGSNRAALAEGQARLASNRAFGETSGNLMNTAFENASTRALQNLMENRNRFLQGAGLNINQAQASTDIGRGGLQGNQQNIANWQAKVQGLNQAGDYFGNQQRQQQELPLRQLELLRNILGTFNVSGAGQSFGAENKGLLNNIFGSGGNGLGIGAGLSAGSGIISGLTSLFSDRKLKENITKVGNKNGINIYEFNYKGHKQKYRGVMADEVKEIMPDAVTNHNGFNAVNYDMLGIKFEEVA